MKKKINSLKIMRVILALLFFAPFLFIFVDFTGKSNILARLAHLQIIPAIVGGMLGVLAMLLILTFIFGRIYCSVLCPLGVLQDILERVTTFWMKKKNRTKRYGYAKPWNKLRYLLLAAGLITFVAGSSYLLLLLDPYSNFGRIASNLFHPAYVEMNNVLQSILLKFDNYSLYYQSIYPILFSLFTALFIFIGIGIAVFLSGRIICNTLCPAGALLSIVSRYSLFKITMNKEQCNTCGLCEKNCKAQCIDSQNGTIDASRCVDCYNCISSCTKNGLRYRFVSPFTKKSVPVEGKPGKSRREFIATSATIATTLPLLNMKTARAGRYRRRYRKGMITIDRSIPILPPGAKSLKHFNHHCTACHLCVVKCPNHVIKPAAFEYGPGFLLKPHVSYEDGFCNYDCTVCTEICPTHAIMPITKEEKKLVQMGIADFVQELCVVYTDQTDCGACSEHCPTQAVHMIPYKGMLTIPELTPEICIGCGGCEYICPVRPIRAINVIASETQKTAKAPKVEESKEIKIDSFGF